MPGWTVTNEGALTVALDLTITDELRKEGLAREMVKRIQNFRKESGFEITDRISITGLSMGGFGTWEMALTYPHFFSCAAPVCGGGLSWRAENLKGKKIRVYHGLDDDVVPISYSQQMVDAARSCGVDVDFTAYDKVGHGSWFKAYAETDLIDWLASQVK